MSRTLLRLVTVLGLIVLVTGLTIGGSLLPMREPAAARPVDPDGRTVTICPAAPTISVASTTAWGSLGVREVGQESLRTIPTGTGSVLTDNAGPMLMVAEGRQNQASAASAFAREAAGPSRGLGLARCGTPATSLWFTGLVSNPDDPVQGLRSEVVLINPDEGQAEVDLVLFGPNGVQTAAGTRGIAVPARSVRTVALETLFTRPDPVGVEVRANRGRVAAVVRQHVSAGVQPTGTDWQVSSTAPAETQVVPGIPGGPGPRTLVVSNPNKRRTTATVEVLGPQGTFAPADAASIDLNAESTAAVSLTAGLDGAPGAVRIVADQPLVAAVVARSAENGPDVDIAIQPASVNVSGIGIAALAAAPGVTGDVLVTNGGDAEVVVPLTADGVNGREVAATELVVPPGSTAGWRLEAMAEIASVRLDAPEGSRLWAGVAVSSAADPVGGLATSPLSVPERQQGGGIEPEFDPGAGR